MSKKDLILNKNNEPKNVEIFIMSGNKVPSVKKDEYTVLQVGAAINKDIDISDVKDNLGKNISTKNRNYCELTGLYWVWKNSKSKIVGLTHYRRFFFKNMFSKNINNVLEEKDIESILKKYQMIVPTMGHTYRTVEKQYAKYHDIKDLMTCREIIKNDYPKYLVEFDKLMKRKCYYPFNMFICKKELIDEYCKWLFSIFDKAEVVIDKTLDSKDNYNKRVYGFLSERLFNVWIRTNKIKVKEMTVYNIDNKKSYEYSVEIIKKIMNILRVNK